MKFRTQISLIGLFLVLVANAFAADLPFYSDNGQIIHGGSISLNKAAGDTIDLMGPTASGAAYLGDFEAGWNGWTSVDVTQPETSQWQVSDYNQAVAGNLAAWCGTLTYDSCNDSLDTVGGYGNSWNELMSYRLAVVDPGASAVVTVTATLQHDTEPGYDFTYFSAKVENQLGYIDINSWDGEGTIAVNETFSYQPADLVDGTDVYVMFRFDSDGGWSDADCSFYGAGACQIDDIVVTVAQPDQADVVSTTDFQDGTFGDWFADLPDGVGDFAALRFGLRGIDPCGINFTQQVTFIDDGLVVPGTGGSDCINWCYGPGGYIVNTTGGLIGPTGHIQIDVYSPVMNWPSATDDGIIFAFDVYRHEDLSADAPGIFYLWDVRSADTDGSAGNGVQDIEDENFLSRNFVFHGGPDYVRVVNDVTDLMNPGRDEVQVKLGVYELGWAWGWIGNDGYPAPYFDNVSVKIFPYVGPGMSARELDLAQDNFPEADAINFANLGELHVRFDMANNISLPWHLRNDPGDSFVVDISPVRTGAVLAGVPEMHYTIDANPVFDGYRTTATTGMVPGAVAVGVSGPVPDRWAFDLPDTGTLFPGDVLHYYIKAGDDASGDVQWATMPADISGFGDFSDPMAYNSTFVVHALPSIADDGFDGHEVPGILFWNDFANRGGEDEWYNAFRQIGLVAGQDYDIYYTNAPSSGVGNGIGGRTTGLALEHYDNLLYSAGDLGVNTISNADFNNDPGDDTGALLNWLSNGNKGLFITGDDVASDLAYNQAGGTGAGFAENVLGVDLADDSIRYYIDNQTTPLILATNGNPVFFATDSWIAYGGCYGINNFDAVTARAGAVKLAEFADSNGNPGAYTFSAATLNLNGSSNKVISLPYDLMYVYTDQQSKVVAPLPSRTLILRDVLSYFGASAWIPVVSSVPEAGQLSLANAPNPFNPSTKISYTIARPGHLSLKVYNVRGALVKTLIDGHVAKDDFVMWDGTSDEGGDVSSGVYFYEARMAGDSQVSKMTLVK